EELIEPDIREEVKARIEECEEAEHPPEADEGVDACYAAKRTHGEGNEEKPKGPGPGRIRDIADRVRAQRPCVRLPGGKAQGYESGEEKRRLQHSPDESIADLHA